MRGSCQVEFSFPELFVAKFHNGVKITIKEHTFQDAVKRGLAIASVVPELGQLRVVTKMSN